MVKELREAVAALVDDVLPSNVDRSAMPFALSEGGGKTTSRYDEVRPCRPSARTLNMYTKNIIYDVNNSSVPIEKNTPPC